MIRLEKYPDIGEGHITLLPFKPHSIGQGTWKIHLSTSELFNGDLYNDTNASGDNFSLKLFLARGTYTMNILTGIWNGSGICRIDLDGVQIAQNDHYSASSLSNQIFTTTNIVVATPGLKTLLFTVNGKNASSSGHTVRVQCVELFRTA